MSKCTECGQEKPRTFKGGDLVQSRRSPHLFGIVVGGVANAALEKRYGIPMRGSHRLVMLTGGFAGDTTQWHESGMDIVTGVFKVATRR